MPGIGRPEAPSNFSNISMGRPEGARAPESEGARKKNDPTNELGNKLNQVSNNGITTGGVKFVDRKRHNQMGKDEFMKLLTYQLSNQDPTAPMDQKKMASDMAQFAQLEQLSAMNNRMEEMAKASPAQNKFYGVGLMGKEVTTSGTSINYDGESRSVEIPFYLPVSAKRVTVNMYDKQNQLVGKITQDEMGKGSQSVTWNGMSTDGASANKGEYRIEVRAFDEQLNPFMGETRTKGLVTGVSFENGEMVLSVGNKKVFLRDVDKFQLPGNNGESPAAALPQQATAPGGIPGGAAKMREGISQYQQQENSKAL